ncbi:hypothetical protein RX914_11050 [Pseudomonas syringae pv. actinidiae]|nr:hypothetical protein [Pseudomonas syringae pv. actinidiae]MDU8258040.1 hypothetical protein [Pseudomonas syringae pv. actinidiae]MDU8261167.1 hypothetical protein [Pseudomonas syringae pv. actinidiae]MDU8295506.1 hypothetical protein [Pseudomonas syringae pv. actinidiae]MDU8311476.1 hypothetical protein [Pseudomonas syringae pv. actinidiae]
MFELYLKKIQSRVSTELFNKLQKNISNSAFDELEVQTIRNAVFSTYKVTWNAETQVIDSLHDILNVSFTDLEKREIIIKIEQICRPELADFFVAYSGKSFLFFYHAYFKQLTDSFVKLFIERSIVYTKNPDEDFRKNPKNLSAWKTKEDNSYISEFEKLIESNGTFIFDGTNTTLNKIIQNIKNGKRSSDAVFKLIDEIENKGYIDIIKSKRRTT